MGVGAYRREHSLLSFEEEHIDCASVLILYGNVLNKTAVKCLQKTEEHNVFFITTVPMIPKISPSSSRGHSVH